MLTFIVRRIAYSIPVLLIASLLVFVFVHATTDPLAKYATSRDLTLKAREGLLQGIYEQPCRHFTAGATPVPAETCKKAPVLKEYWFWLSHFVQGKMGTSFVSNRPVSTDLKSSFGNTLQLLIWGVLLSALLAVCIGVYSAVRQYSLPDYLFTGLSFVGLSMPPFWFGLIAIDIFSERLRHTLHTQDSAALQPRFARPPWRRVLRRVLRLRPAPGASCRDPDRPDRRLVEPVPAFVDARRAVGRLHPHRDRQGRGPLAG